MPWNRGCCDGAETVMESKLEPHSQDTHPDPVTVIVRHLVKRGSEADFEQWLRGITAAMRSFAGQQGYNVVRPVEKNRPTAPLAHSLDAYSPNHQ